MFERFDDLARFAVVRARREAHALGHDTVDTEHLLLALLREPDAARAREAVVRLRGRGDDAPEQVRFAEGAKRVFERAARRSPGPVGAEQLFAALTAEERGLWRRVLQECGLPGGG